MNLYRDLSLHKYRAIVVFDDRSLIARLFVDFGKVIGKFRPKKSLELRNRNNFR